MNEEGDIIEAPHMAHMGEDPGDMHDEAGADMMQQDCSMLDNNQPNADGGNQM